MKIEVFYVVTYHSIEPHNHGAFKADLDALNWADTCLLVLPCGRSAHTEAGWMKGAGKKVVVYPLILIIKPQRSQKSPRLSCESGRRGSNSRPQPWQGCALPTELLPHKN